MMESAEILHHLTELEKHPGWKVITERYTQGVAEVVAKILEQSTDNELTLKLKHAHGLLVEADPTQLMKTLRAKHRKLAIDAAKEAVRQGAATDGAGE